MDLKASITHWYHTLPCLFSVNHFPIWTSTCDIQYHCPYFLIIWHFIYFLLFSFRNLSPCDLIHHVFSTWLKGVSHKIQSGWYPRKWHSRFYELFSFLFSQTNKRCMRCMFNLNISNYNQLGTEQQYIQHMLYHGFKKKKKKMKIYSFFVKP